MGGLQETGFVIIGVGIDGIKGLNAGGGTRGLQNGAAGAAVRCLPENVWCAGCEHIFRAQRNPDQPFRGGRFLPRG